MTILEQYNSLREDMRSYDHESWHTVNVKRYHDYIKPEDIEKEAKRLTSDKNILPALTAYGIKYSEDNDAYCQWIGDASNMLKEDIEGSGELSLKHIKQHGTRKELDYKSRCNTCRRLTWYETEQACHFSDCTGTLKVLEKPVIQDDRTYIYQLGRSGGWICFKDTAEDIANELEEDEDNRKRGIEALLTSEDLADQVKNLTEAVAEIEALKDFIQKYNAGLKWSDEVFFRMSEKLEELKEEEKEAIKNRDITTMTLGSLLSHKNEAVKRNAIGILKQLNKK